MVSMITGMCASCGSDFMTPSTDQPSIFGIMTSRVTMSGGLARMMFSASMPSLAWVIR